tara:strand:+ start:337 stop:537 length:201 start_codon:yes stop_codon:yes gene_type:complete
MRKFENQVQRDYYNKFNEIWAGGVDDWFDMNNFMYALTAFVKDVFHKFSFFTLSCLNDNDTFEGGK